MQQKKNAALLNIRSTRFANWYMTPHLRHFHVGSSPSGSNSNSALWAIMFCSFVKVNKHLRGTYCCHFQHQSYFLILNMEVIWFLKKKGWLQGHVSQKTTLLYKRFSSTRNNGKQEWRLAHGTYTYLQTGWLSCNPMLIFYFSIKIINYSLKMNNFNNFRIFQPLSVPYFLWT
jgi:hypothetical protein